MKKLIGLVIVLIVLILGSYYGMGYITEKKVKEGLGIINQSNGLRVEILNYKRRWFTSKALLSWNLHVPEHAVTNAQGQNQVIPAEDYQLKMPIKIFHGPIIFADRKVKFGFGYAHTKLGLPPQYQEKFDTSFTKESTKPKLRLSLFVSFLNNISYDIRVPQFKLIAKQGNGQFDWLGMNSTTTISSKLNKFHGHFVIDGLKIKKEQVDTVISTITSDYNLHKTTSGLFLGKANLALPSVTIADHGKKIFDLNQFAIFSDSHIKKRLFYSQLKMSLEKVVIDGTPYGPGRLEVAIRNIDADLLAKFNEQINQAQQTGDLERQKILFTLFPEFPKLFSKGAEFEIKELNFVMPQGAIEGNLLISLPKEGTGNIFELLQKTQGKGKLKVPAAVLKQALIESYKHRLMIQSSPQAIQQGVTQQIQQQNSEVTPGSSTSQAPAPTPTPTSTQQVNAAAIAQEATSLADRQLATMLQTGALTQQGSDYVVEINLNQGQLLVNGKPFNPSMLQFQ